MHTFPHYQDDFMTNRRRRKKRKTDRPGSKTKIPPPDTDFERKMFEHCNTDEERLVLTVLGLTGIHVSCLSELTESNMQPSGDTFHLSWERPKTGLAMSTILTPESAEAIRPFLVLTKKAPITYWKMVRDIGNRAGFGGISPMTYRHLVCVRELDRGIPYPIVAQMLGTTIRTLERHYSKVKGQRSMLARSNEATALLREHQAAKRDATR